MSDRAISVLVYGDAKAGKSTFATTAPAPRLYIDLESASRFLLHLKKIKWDPATQAPPEPDGTWDTAVVDVHEFAEIQKAYDWLRSGKHPFKSVIIDSFGEVQVRAQEDINGRDRMKQQSWGELLSRVSFLGRDLRDLTTHKVNPLEAVVIVSTMQEKNGKAQPYLQGQIASQIPYWYDMTGYYWVSQDTNPETGDTTENRNLLIGNNPNYVAGTRVPGLPSILVNPNIEQLLEDVFGPRPE